MKKKIVIWANDENDKKILVGLELKAQENKIAVHTFPEEIATELFYNEMMENWRNDKDVVFPEGYTTIERELNVTESILPDNIKVNRSDIVNRAATEWQFIVLSTKLYEMYKSELEDRKEKVMEMTYFDKGVWAEMKEFWGKVQNQVYDNNLLRDHANQLKEGTNAIFEKLKKLRLALDKELDEISKRNKGVFNAKLAEVDEKINKGLGLKPIFEELKKIQLEYKDSKFNRKDRSEIWDRIDAAFKKVKSKKGGGTNQKQGGSNNSLTRIQRRYDGLMSALGKMEHSIVRDQKDIDYENRKINTTDGQLEQQIRQAKLKMIEERISSKKVKLDDMLKTKAELELKLEKEKKKIEVNKAKLAAKEKIASQIQEKNESLSEEDQSKLQKAAEDLAEGKKQKTKKDPAKVVKAKEEMKEVIKNDAAELKEAIADVKEAADDVANDEANSDASNEESLGAGILGAVGGMMATAKDMVEDAMDSVQAAAEVAKDSISEAMTGEKDNDDIVPSATEQRGEKVNELLSSTEKDESTAEEASSGSLLEAATGLFGGALEKAKNLASEATEKIEELGDKVEGKFDDIMDGMEEKSEGKTEKETKEGSNGGILGAAAGLLGGAMATAKTLAGEAKEKLEDLGEIVEEKFEDSFGEEE